MFWQMPAISEGFDLPGEHDVAPSLTKWGSGTVDVLISEMQLTITSWDIDPQGQKSKAIETVDNREYSGIGGHQPVRRAPNRVPVCRASLGLMLTSDR